MSSTDHDVRQFESNRDKPTTANSDYDNARSTAERKRKPSAMTRRMSFSRPWSSYAENYSSCLSGLRRNSSEQLYRRQGSPQSSPTTSCNDLSKSLDSGQLRNLKATTPDSEEQRKAFKISAMHARPFHQRRWSSPVAFSVAKLAPSDQKASKQFDEENGSGGVRQDCGKDKNKDKICETDEIILSQKQDKTPVSQPSTPHCKGSKMESKVVEKTSNDPPIHSSGKALFSDQHLVESCNEKVNREAGKVESTNMNKSQPLTDEIKSESLSISSVVKEEEPTQSRNIYSEIKKNTKWTKSKRFRRRHHTIHTDSRRFLNPTLFTIAEQSSGSFGSVIRNDRCDQVVTGKLTSRRSKSLGDLNTLSDDMKTNGVSVQQLCAKSICVSVASINTKKNKESPSVRSTTVVYKGEEKSTSSRQISCPVQVNIQQFNQIQISPGIERQHKPQASKIQSYYSTQQHAIFTQPKAKWTSITISQV